MWCRHSTAQWIDCQNQVCDSVGRIGARDPHGENQLESILMPQEHVARDSARWQRNFVTQPTWASTMSPSNFIDQLMLDTASGISRSLSRYWPSKHNIKTPNALREAHALTHLAHAALMRDCFVYPEAACHKEIGRASWIDMLLWCSIQDAQIRIEAKRIFDSSGDNSAEGLMNDHQKAVNFTPNVPNNSLASILECSKKKSAL